MVCGSIAGKGTQRIKRFSEFLRRNGFTTLGHLMAREMDYSHITDFRNKRDLARKIVKYDLEYVRKADVIIVLYEPPSYGAAIEMFVAKELGKKVVLFAPRPVATPWAIHFSDHVVTSRRELITLLKQLRNSRMSPHA